MSEDGLLDCEVVLTRSGAPAVRDRITGELMHPVVGPQVEAQRLYIGPSNLAARLGRPSDSALVLLDVGLGAASNAIAAWRLSESLGNDARRLEIISFDRSLAALKLALEPTHTSAFGLGDAAGDAAHALLKHGHHTTARTTWRYVEGDLLSTLSQQAASNADVVFWDPFSPSANPQLWTMRAFTALRRLCRAGATVHTYSGATAVRSAMLLGGFAVGTDDSVGGVKKNTCAAVDLADLGAPLDLRWLDRLSRSSAPFPSDAPEDALERISALPQFSHRA